MSRLISNGRHLPYNPENKSRVQELRKYATRWEKKLWFDCLKGNKPQFYRQRPIDHYIVDFYCPAQKLVIEVDGGQHFTEAGMGNDMERTQVLNGYGLKIVRFTNKEIEENFDDVKQMIYDLINSSASSDSVHPLNKGGRLKAPLDKEGGIKGGINL